MAIERKTVTNDQHPFAAMSGGRDAPSATTPPPAPPRAAAPPQRAADETDPLISRTYRLPNSMELRMERAALALGVQRGHRVTKTDVLREALDQYLERNDLDH